MADTVIEIENVSKAYRLGTINHGTMRQDIESWWAGIRGKEDPNAILGADGAPRQGKFWALRDVSFEVRSGDAVGIIGRNGAGKSTLLKILSQVTTPTAGLVRICGRVASLLEVGTGFHPELTGRENVFLNGTILGMSKAEIKGKFEEIVDFSGVEKFIDTPVKRYSSGMYVRLAFSVAAHLEPEILIVDEVLAVGDAQFQMKCLGKMGKISSEGRTILFVSHNLAALAKLCSHGIILKDGMVQSVSSAENAVRQYLDEQNLGDFVVMKQSYDREVDLESPLSLQGARILVGESCGVATIPRGGEAAIEIDYVVNRKVAACHVYAKVFNSDGQLVFGTGDADMHPERFAEREVGRYRCRFMLPTHILNEGKYTVSLSTGVPYKDVYQHDDHVLGFNIVNLAGNKFVHERRAGLLFVDIPWVYLSGEPGQGSR